MTDRDPLADALNVLQAPPLAPHLAALVGAKARAELRATEQSSATHYGARLRHSFGAGLVPALLTLAAVMGTAASATTAAKIYGKQEVSTR